MIVDVVYRLKYMLEKPTENSVEMISSNFYSSLKEAKTDLKLFKEHILKTDNYINSGKVIYIEEIDLDNVINGYEGSRTTVASEWIEDIERTESEKKILGDKFYKQAYTTVGHWRDR